MTEGVPLAAALVTAVLALLGAVVAAVGALGLLRLRSFYARAHPPTLATTLGATCILLASAVYFSFLEGRFMPKALLAIVFIPLVNPVTTMLLARAALARDRTQAYGARPEPGSEDAEWRRKAVELADAQAEAARRVAEDAPPEADEP